MYPSNKNLLLAFLLALVLSVNAFPQQQPPFPQDAPTGRTQSRARARRTTKTPVKPAPQKPPCRTGDFIVPIDSKATGSFNIPICIAQHSPVVIEFPASDPFYAHHPGDEKFVTIDKRSKTTDPLVIRPGDGFYVEPGRVRPSSVISVQMTSGLVGSFPIYAVEDVSLNNNHVIVSYDRDEVVAARRRLGLRADLVSAEVLAALQDQPEGSQPVRTSTPETAPQSAPKFLPRTSVNSEETQQQITAQHAPAPATNPAPPRQNPAPMQRPPFVPSQTFAASNITPLSTLPAATVAARPVPSLPSKPVGEQIIPASPLPNLPAVSVATNTLATDNSISSVAPDLENLTRDEMMRMSNSKQPLRFGSPRHGLSLSVGRSRFIVTGYRVEVIAVRNTLAEPVRLVPGQPEIYVETMNDGRPINAPRLTPRFTVSTLPVGAMLLPGGTYYFAFAFDEPILGVNDYLRVAVSQTNAADEPVSANLITAAR